MESHAEDPGLWEVEASFVGQAHLGPGPAACRVMMPCASQTLPRSPAGSSQNKSRPLQLRAWGSQALKQAQSLHTHWMDLANRTENRLLACSRYLFTNHSHSFVQVGPLNAHEPILNFSTSLESRECVLQSVAIQSGTGGFTSQRGREGQGLTCL